MNATIINNDFENITNTWKNIFSDFIELVVVDGDNIYGQRVFKILREINAEPGIWTKLFLENFTANIIYEYEGNAILEVFLSLVFRNFNELHIMSTQIEPIKQYLKHLCVELELGENYYADVDENTDNMDNDTKTQFCISLLQCTSRQFAELNKKFIEDIFINILTPPATYIK